MLAHLLQWFLIGYAYLHLLNIRTLTGRNDKAVRVARRLVGFVLGSSSICEVSLLNS